MILHPKKTKVMLIGTHQKLAKSDSLNIYINAELIEQSSCEKLLGIYIDSSLTWNEQVSKLIKKFNTKLELIRQARPYISPSKLLLLYNTIARPTMEYCCSVWGNCSKESMDRLLLAQKRGARLLLNADAMSPSLPLFQNLLLLPISDVIIFRLLILVHQCLYGSAPPCLASLLTKPMHRYCTRAADDHKLLLPKAKTNSCKRSFSFLGSSLWNKLPSCTTKCSSHKAFKAQIWELAKNKLLSVKELQTQRLY